MFDRLAAAVLLLSSGVWDVAAESYCPTAPTVSGDRRSDQSKFRLVHFNAEWLYIDGYDNCPGSNCPWTDQQMAETHLSAIAGVLADLDGDLVNLCEVESCDELKDLLNDPQLSGKGYAPYMIEGTDSSTGQDVGMLTRIDPLSNLIRTEARVSYPLPGSTCNSTYTGTYGVSKHYITTFTVNGMKIAIFSMHLLAYPDDQNRCVQREAQATVMQQAITPYINDGYEVIVLGDLNDWDSTAVDVNGNLPISQVTSLLRGQGTKWSLTNAISVMPKDERYSIWWDQNYDCIFSVKECSQLDHIMVSDGLLGKITNVFVAHNEYQQSCDNFYYSDHWPVVIDFAF